LWLGENRLTELAGELRDAYGTDVLVVPQDLTEPGSVKKVVNKVWEHGWNVDVLVNNVGVATYGWFGDIDIDRELAMIDLNCKVPVELTHYCLPHMKQEGFGGIINMGGLLDRVKAGTFSTYCATKAFDATFSECLNEELHGTGIDVVCLTPGYNPETEIFDAAGVQGSFPFPRGNPNAVARHGLSILRKKRAVAINGVTNKILSVVLKFTPIRMRQAINKILVGKPEGHLASSQT
jgi:short-subunit dehydrogenase